VQRPARLPLLQGCTGFSTLHTGRSGATKNRKTA